MGKLTVLKARAATSPGLYGDGGTLFLSVAPGGSKSWVQRVTIRGKRVDIGLGGFPLVPLAEAREKAIDNRRVARAGGDPLAEKRRALVPTFKAALEETIKSMRGRWRTGSPTESIWRRTLEKHAAPFMDKRVDAITGEDILRVVSPIWTSKPEVAKRTRQFTRSVLSWAQAHGYVEHNVAGEAIAGALPTATATRQHHRALPHADVPEALRVVDASKAGPAVKLCFRLVVLTAVRETAKPGSPGGQSSTWKPGRGRYRPNGRRSARNTVSRCLTRLWPSWTQHGCSMMAPGTCSRLP